MIAHRFCSIVLIAGTAFISTAGAQRNANAQNLTAVQERKTTLAGSADTHLRIGPGDLLEIKVFDASELDQTVRVTDQGDIVFTLLGEVHVAGMTVAEAETMIDDRLRVANLLLAPHVSILISEYQTQGVSMLGEVDHPGIYPVLGAKTLLDLISAAGGTTHIASHEATIRHAADGSTISVSLSRNAGDLLASNVQVFPGDTIIVPKAGVFYMLGDVGRPGGYVMDDDGKITLLEAIAVAGGVNRTAALSKARIVRKTATGYREVPFDVKKVLMGKQDDLSLEPEDIVYIPTSVAKSIMDRTPQVLQAAASSSEIYAVGVTP
jgi:polysaccharide export outer membrane protein